MNSVNCSTCGSMVEGTATVCTMCGMPLEPTEFFATLAPGTFLDARYRLDAVLGQGGFGITYSAHDTRLDRQVAIKEMFPGGCVRHGVSVMPTGPAAASFAESRIQFVKEAQTLARLRHHAIVQVFEVFETANTAYLVMELLHGETYEERVQRLGPLSPDDTGAVLRSVASALALVHNEVLLHRDVKPSNIMCVQGEPILIDFGAARSFANEITTDMSRLVTPGYSPLEQYSGRGRFGPSSDIYSLAATGYFLLTGHVPTGAIDRLQGVELSPLPFAAEHTAVGSAITAGLEIAPANRPSDIGQFEVLLGCGPDSTANNPAADVTRTIRLGTSNPSQQTASPTRLVSPALPIVTRPPRKKSPALWVGLAVIVLGGAIGVGTKIGTSGKKGTTTVASPVTTTATTTTVTTTAAIVTTTAAQATDLPIIPPPIARPPTITDPPIPAVETVPMVIGQSVRGLDLRGWRSGSGPRVVIVVGGIHGDQVEGTDLPTAALDLMTPALGRKITLIAVSHLNPDGRTRGVRENANGVDLNRNFPADSFTPSSAHGNSPLDQPETRAFYELVKANSPVLVLTSVSSSSQSGFVDFDGPARSYANTFTSASRSFSVASAFKRTPGSLGQWLGVDQRVPLLTLTFKRGTSSRTARSQAIDGLSAVLEAVGRGE